MSAPSAAAPVAVLPPEPRRPLGRRQRGPRTPTYAYEVPAPTRRAQRRLGIVFVAPLLALVLTFLILPMANAVYYVFVDFNGINPAPPFVGLANFTEMFRDPDVYAALRNNVIWIVIGTVGPIALGLALALLVWNVRRLSVLYRTAIFLPVILPQVAVGIVWGWIYEPTRGWLNRVLEAVGLDAVTTGWLGNPDTALYAVLGTAIWATVGFVFVILLSALRNVDVDLIDAALLDGAGFLQRLRHIILPQIMPVFLMVTTVTLIGGFGVFDIVFVMTGGGPSGASEVLGTYAYSNAFELNRISYGTTIALLMTLLAVPFAVWLNRFQQRLAAEAG